MNGFSPMAEQSRVEPGRRKAEVESGQLETEVELEAWRTGVTEVEPRDQRIKEELVARKTEGVKMTLELKGWRSLVQMKEWRDQN